jgi:hypothetical protein
VSHVRWPVATPSPEERSQIPKCGGSYSLRTASVFCHDGSGQAPRLRVRRGQTRQMRSQRLFRLRCAASGSRRPSSGWAGRPEAARSPDIVRAAAPLSSPLLRPRKGAGRRMVQGRERRDDDHQGRGLSGGMTGDGPRRGCRPGAPSLARGALTRTRRRRRSAVPASLGRWWPAVTRQPAPAEHVRQRLTRNRRAVRVQ